MPNLFRGKSLTENSYNHNFIHYKLVNQTEYQKKYNIRANMKEEQQNFVYKHLRNQKIVNSMLYKLFNIHPEKSKTRKNHKEPNYLRTPSRMSEDQSRIKTQNCIELKRREEFDLSLKKVDSFNNSLKNFHRSMSANKKRMNTLHKFNKFTRQVLQKLPEHIQEQTRQSIQEKQQLMKILIEQINPNGKKQPIQKKTKQILSFNSPVVSQNLKKEFLTRKKRSEIRQILKTTHS